ncbi:MAG: hypothetical protein EBV03_08640, partial [Proteobacteria bacterium]|nr:hypothetical protein [Pseudomonadota bacterium]
ELSLPEVPDAHSNNPALNNLLEQPYVAPEVPDEVEADYQARDPNDPEKINEELAQKKTKEKFDIMSKVGGGIKTRSEGAKGGTLSKGGRESEAEALPGILPKIEGEEEAAAKTSRATTMRGSKSAPPPPVSAPDTSELTDKDDGGNPKTMPRGGIQLLSKSGKNNPGLSKGGQKTPAVNADGTPELTDEEKAELEEKKKDQDATEVNELFNRLEQ